MNESAMTERGEWSTETEHQVTLTQDSSIGTAEVAQRQWVAGWYGD